MNRHISPLLVLFLLAGCASAPQTPAVAVIGTVADQERFAGLWRGSLDAVDDREDGPLEFRLSAGTGTLLTRLAPGAGRILWVRVNGATLSGAVEARWDERCQCDVYTTFEATLEDSELRGTLRRREKLLWHDVGTWTAVRVTE
ncbi:MAG TPA: hypothetical protein VMS98_08975 [Thermoanaerobaculia bacterium]|nr:hypothetical protein [Thermoanaerobaculia bacterium]